MRELRFMHVLCTRIGVRQGMSVSMVFTSVCVYKCTCVQVYVCMRHTHVRNTHVRTHECIHGVYECMRAQVYVCMSVRVYQCINALV